MRSGTTGDLPYGFLITDLYRKVGVQWHTSEQVQQPMVIIDHLTIEKYKAWEGAISLVIGGAGYIMIPPPSPQVEAESYVAPPKPMSSFQRRMER